MVAVKHYILWDFFLPEGGWLIAEFLPEGGGG